MPSQRIPLVGSLVNRNSNVLAFSAKDQRFENCYPEVTRNPITGKTSVHLYKRLGTAAITGFGGNYVAQPGCLVWTGASLGNSSPNGVFSFLDAGATTMKFLRTAGTTLGTLTGIDGGPGWITETMISDTPTLTIIAHKSGAGAGILGAWSYDLGAGFVEITDTDYPAKQSTPLQTVGEMIHMDGWAFIMTREGKIFNSDVNSVTSWSANGVIAANSMPDGGCGLARLRDTIYAFGRGSIEGFKNTGNPSGSPLSRTGNAITTIGCIFSPDQRVILTTQDAIFFLGSDVFSGKYGVYRISANGVEKISTGAVDKLMAAVGGSISIAGSFVMHGMTHILLFESNGPTQPCYCVETGLWWYLVAGSTASFFSACLGRAGNAYFSAFPATGNGLWNADPTAPVFVDGVSVITEVVQTEPIDFGVMNRKFIKRVRPVCDVQSATSTLTIAYSDDDYANFTTAGTIDLSSLTAIQQGLTRLGSYKGGRAWKLTHASNTPNRMQALDIDYEVAR